MDELQKAIIKQVVETVFMGYTYEYTDAYGYHQTTKQEPKIDNLFKGILETYKADIWAEVSKRIDWAVVAQLVSEEFVRTIKENPMNYLPYSDKDRLQNDIALKVKNALQNTDRLVIKAVRLEEQEI